MDIYTYNNYRDYLRDEYQTRKTSPRGFSYRAFAKRCGFSSPNFIKLVIDGQRKLSDSSAGRIAEFLQLTGRRREYFLALVQFNQAASDADRRQLWAQLQRFLPAAKRRNLDQKTLEYMENWHYAIVREMTELAGFRDDPYWIHRRLWGDIEPRQIAASLNYLLKAGFIERTDNGLRACDDMVLSKDELASLAVRSFHRQLLRQAEAALEEVPLGDREFASVVFALPHDALGELKDRIKHFRKSLHHWAVAKAKDLPSDAVVQLSIQMFPHTRRLKDDQTSSS